MSEAEWHAENQRGLVADLERVRRRLEARLSADVATDASQAEHEATRSSALDAVCAAFELSPFERDVLLLCAGVELDSSFAGLCASAHGDLRRTYPTFGLALSALSDAHWSALAPSGPLRRWRLIEVLPGDALTQSPLRIDERVLHYLTGVSYLDQRLAGLLEPIMPPQDCPDSLPDVAQRIAAMWTAAPGAIVDLSGEDRSVRRGAAALACQRLGLHLISVRASEMPGSASERDDLVRLCEREAVLSAAALLVESDDVDHLPAAEAFLDGLHGPALSSGRLPIRLRRRTVLRMDVPSTDAVEQKRTWEIALGAAAGAMDGRLDSVVGQFALELDGIRAVAAQVVAALPVAALDPGTLLWDACRAHARPRLGELAQRIEPKAAWEDLVLPEGQIAILREIAAHARQRARVYGTWGFARKTSRGLGISALFTGASGTGKTMAAEVLAQELRLDLYRIDLSQVVSKYIGETEKNLRRVFDAAESGGALLLFDEADALFGKRSEVKDSHDRYANIEVSYLLQRMEEYRGLAILTTNLRHALDPSFLRRLRFVVEFPFPDVQQRAEIWRRIFPSETPTESLDPGRLARLNMSGGSIHNVALHAAFLAADEGQPVRMGHVFRAARTEYAKLDKPLTGVEMGASP